MRIVPSLAVSLLFGVAGTVAASAAPAPAQPGLIVGGMVETVDWHPSTSHWDHHFHSHQDSLRDHQPTEAERRLHSRTRHGGAYARNHERSRYR